MRIRFMLHSVLEEHFALCQTTMPLPSCKKICKACDWGIFGWNWIRQTIGVARGGQRAMSPQKFLENSHFVLWEVFFEYLAPQNFWAGYATVTDEMVWFAKIFNLGNRRNTLIKRSSKFKQCLWCMLLLTVRTIFLWVFWIFL